jgi:hypothetical protein
VFFLERNGEREQLLLRQAVHVPHANTHPSSLLILE